ncbi:MAG: hypothetical protein QF535_04715 [Anaerolineales bacterium]|jgi:hypothetical protein|nr:hypothetical protein [Anaerolineales bacterium]
MANTFLNEQVQDVTTGWSDIGSAVTSQQRTIIGMTVANTVSSVISVDVAILNGSTRTYLVKSAPIPTGGSLIVVGGDQKVVLDNGDKIQVQSNTATSADVVMSMLDIT